MVTQEMNVNMKMYAVVFKQGLIKPRIAMINKIQNAAIVHTSTKKYNQTNPMDHKAGDKNNCPRFQRIYKSYTSKMDYPAYIQLGSSN